MAKIKKQKGYITHKSKNTENLSVTKIKIKNGNKRKNNKISPLKIFKFTGKNQKF